MRTSARSTQSRRHPAVPFVTYNYTLGNWIRLQHPVRDHQRLQRGDDRHVTVWTDWSFPLLDFNILLTGYDVKTSPS